MKRGIKQRLFRLVAWDLAALAAYRFAIRPWHLKWGSCPSEVEESLPGDELVAAAKLEATRGVTIDAGPGDVWPWLLQLGEGRGGFYSYTLLENLLGAKIHNVDQILPELQTLKVGDTVRLAPESAEGAPSFGVAELTPERSLVLWSGLDQDSGGNLAPGALPDKDYAAASWAFQLSPANHGKTRLLARSRFAWSAGWKNFAIWRLLTEPTHFIMERKMLLEIKKLAENLAAERRWVEPEAPGGQRQKAA